MTWEYNHYLSHHGVKGQKWGVRRYQNKDGSLTKEGRQRLLDSLDSDHRADKGIVKTAPQDLAFSREHKEQYISAMTQKGRSKKSTEEEFNRSEKYLSDLYDQAQKDMVFNTKVKELLDNNKKIKVSDLQSAIEETAKESGLDAEWVISYYNQEFGLFEKNDR